MFALNFQELENTGSVKHVIITGDRPLVGRQLICHTPFILRNKVDETVQEMLTQGVANPFHWASPTVLVKKKDGGILTIIN